MALVDGVVLGAEAPIAGPLDEGSVRLDDLERMLAVCGGGHCEARCCWIEGIGGIWEDSVERRRSENRQSRTGDGSVTWGATGIHK